MLSIDDVKIAGHESKD